MLGVLKNQLPPTVTTISQSRRASLLEVCAASCGNGPEARTTRKEPIRAVSKAKAKIVHFSSYYLEAVLSNHVVVLLEEGGGKEAF